MAKPTPNGTGPDRRGIPAEAGLCARCRHVRPLRSARGSLFLRCDRAGRMAELARYPALPVRACPGFEPDPDP